MLTFSLPQGLVTKGQHLSRLSVCHHSLNSGLKRVLLDSQVAKAEDRAATACTQQSFLSLFLQLA